MIKLTRELDIGRNNYAYSSSLENCKFRAENLGWKKIHINCENSNNQEICTHQSLLLEIIKIIF